ncbi:hypothetical protein FRB95_011250 [Tulasnella sp. JGI-2019a]|nr:hypothetical protein FRB95_011250 [Tulasnella sp. JGI-2019a]
MEDNSTISDHSLRSLARAEWLSFSGSPSENVLFAQAVHRFAFAQGRQKDGVWMADYTYGCLSDEVLNRFEDLDDDVKQDWSTLRLAMITEFRRNTMVPTAPAAAIGPRLAVMSRSCVACEQVVKADGTELGYISPPTRGGMVTVVASAERALVLDVPKVWDAQQTETNIRMADPSETYPFVGLENHGDRDWNLRACEAEAAFSKGAHVPTPKQSRRWLLPKSGQSRNVMAQLKNCVRSGWIIRALESSCEL